MLVLCKKIPTVFGVPFSTLTLLISFQPSPPTISPANPTATEGRPFNLTCSSVGGSPPPQIKWYKLGYSQMLDATILRGENKDEPTRSILNVVPTKNDDAASFRCTVWNRALRQEHSLEAGTKVFVNCEFLILSGSLFPSVYKQNDKSYYDVL